MRRHFSSELQRSPYAKGRNLRWSFLFLILACLVAFFVVHCLTFPADTLTIEDAQGIFPASMEISASRFTENSHFYSYEDDLLFATVVLPEGASVPEDAVLTVTPIEDTENTYTAAAERVATGEIQQVKLYDVSFYTADGTYLPVSDEAKVTFHFKETVPVESRDNVAVLHFEEDGVKLPSITDVAVQEDNQLTDLSFDTEGFSVYAMVTWSEEMNLDGQSYVITSENFLKGRDTHGVMMAAMGTGEWSKKLAASLCSKIENVDSKTYIFGDNAFTEWHFTKHENGYYIWAGTEDDKKYINTAKEESNGNGDLALSDTPEVFYLEKDSSGKYSGVRIHNANDYAINWYGGGNNTKLVFGLYKERNYSARPDPNDYMILATPVRESMMLFDINLPQIVKSNNAITDAQKNDKDKIYVYGEDWKDGTPTLADSFGIGIDKLPDQPDGYFDELGAAGKLYQEKYGVDTENPYAKLYRVRIRDSYDFTSSWNPEHYLEDFAYYKEVKFVGWFYKDSSGTKHIFDPNAPITHRESDDMYLMTDQAGIQVAVPNGTMFHGQWKIISSPVEFFINYGGTILDTEGDVATRGTVAFTKCASVGTLLYGKNTVGKENLWANEPHEAITAMITPSENVNFESENSQIILETLTDYVDSEHKVYYNNKHHGANFSMLQESLLHWIRNDNSMTIRLSTGDCNVTIDNALATPENYQVRWYVLKDQKDGWHVDGIMTATTEEMTVTKTFRNLSEAEVNKILADGYGIDMKVGKGVYLYLKPENTESTKGQYVYTGSYDAATKTYTCVWTVRVLNGEHYVIQEKGYAYDTNNYNVTAFSTLNNQPDTQRSGDTAGLAGNVTDKKYDVVGGSTRTVAFTNLYSPMETATLTIMKTNADTNLTMQGVHFTLTPIDGDGGATGDASEVITNANGYASFTGLRAGTRYRLEEKLAMDYLKPNTNTMIVDVTKTADSTIPTITVTETQQGGTQKIYTSEPGKPVLLYTVKNYLSSTTAVITKNFENITSDEIKKILNGNGNSDNCYRIVVREADGTVKTTLTAANAVRISSDYKQLIWYVGGLAEGKRYTLTEEHYQSYSTAYENVTVSAEQSTLMRNQSGPEVIVAGKGEAKTASVTVEKGAEHEWISITNSYSNTYDLRLRKVDSVTGKPLSGAVFALYGKHEESTDPSRTVHYTKDGKTITLYYIKDAEKTDSDGFTTIRGLNFSDTAKAYLYVLQETTVPDGYAAPTEITPEQVLEVTPDDVGNGDYALSVHNTAKTEPLTIRKTVSDDLQTKDNTYTIRLTLTDPNKRQGTGEYPFPYQILNADGTEAGSGTFEAGTEAVISLKADQQIQVLKVPVGFTYQITEEITDASGNTLYKPNIITADRSVWSNTITGTMRESAVQLSENWVNIKNYEEMQVPAQKNLTVQKQWSDLTAAAHPAVTVHLYQMQTDAATGKVLKTVEYGTATLDESGNWTHTWENVPQCSGDKTQNYSYFVQEEAVSGYDTRYFTTGEGTAELLPAKCTVDGAELLAAPVDWEKASVTIVNRERPKLPYTGGTGVTRYHVLGLLLTLGAGTGITFRYRKRKHS